MKYFHLVWAALMRRKARTIFTVLSVLAAFLLFGLLDSVRVTFADAGKSMVGLDRLVTVPKASASQLPKSLLSQVQEVPGVKEVAYAIWFGGIYQDPKNSFPDLAVSDNYFDVYSEMRLPPAQSRAFHNTRTGAVVGAALAKKFGWKIGDRIPLQATVYPQKDGDHVWTFLIVGIYHSADPASHTDKTEEWVFFFHWKYFNEASYTGNDKVDMYIEKITNPLMSDQVANAIDALSINSDHETKSQSENAWQVAYFKQFVDVGPIVTAIMAAVFFTLLLLTGNTMAHAVRERIPELAVLKTIGFSHRGVLLLVIAESVLLMLIGGVIGLLLATAVVAEIKHVFHGLPFTYIDEMIWFNAIGLMIAIGLIAGALPALRGMRLKVVDGLAARA
ncbi:MAG: ABC transporter permease [Rhodanobacteraceae bacterium]